MIQPKPHDLLYDAPLSMPDEQDRLGRKDFAKFLAKAISKMDADEGFVFALNGPWGSGKTTLINFALHYLEKEQQGVDKIVVVRFNPWWFSGSEQLIQRFFRQFQSSLGAQDVGKELKDIGQKLDLLAKVIEPISLIPAVGWWANIVNQLLRKIGIASKAAGEAMHKDVFKIRESIDLALRRQDSRILVVLDDIDRLSAEEIRQIFQLVKGVADFPKTIYLLAFDRIVVSSALKEVQGLDGEGYLEKIVQAQFDLPYPDRTSLRRLLFELLDEVITDTPTDRWDDVEWGNLYWDGIDSFIKTPRDIKRFINVLRSTYPVAKDEVNPVDFIGIQSLRLFVPEMYDFIASNKDQLVGASEGDYSSKEEKRKTFEMAIQKIATPKQEAVKGMMQRLFPRWASAFGAPIYGTDWLERWRREAHVCSPEIFDRYFMLTVPPGDISSTEMQSILSKAVDSEAFSSELIRLANENRPDGTTRLRAFLERMLDFTENDIPEDHIEPILRAIYTVGDQLYIERDKVGMLDDGNEMRLLRVTYRLVRRVQPQERRFKIFSGMYADGKALSLMIRELTFLSMEHGKYTDKKPDEPEENRTVGTGHLPKLEAIVLEKLRCAAKEHTLHKTPTVGNILYRFSNLGSEEEVKKYVSDLIQTDDGLCDYFSGFLGKSYSHTIGDRVERLVWRIDVKSVQKFLTESTDSLLPRCEKILRDNPDWLIDMKKTAVETFIREITNPTEE